MSGTDVNAETAAVSIETVKRNNLKLILKETFAVTGGESLFACESHRANLEQLSGDFVIKCK